MSKRSLEITKAKYGLKANPGKVQLFIFPFLFDQRGTVYAFILFVNITANIKIVSRIITLLLKPLETKKTVIQAKFANQGSSVDPAELLLWSLATCFWKRRCTCVLYRLQDAYNLARTSKRNLRTY